MNKRLIETIKDELTFSFSDCYVETIQIKLHDREFFKHASDEEYERYKYAYFTLRKQCKTNPLLGDLISLYEFNTGFNKLTELKSKEDFIDAFNLISSGTLYYICAMKLFHQSRFSAEQFGKQLIDVINNEYKKPESVELGEYKTFEEFIISKLKERKKLKNIDEGFLKKSLRMIFARRY